MKLILLALILSSFCHANTIVLEHEEAPRNKLSGVFSMLLPTTVLLQKEMLEVAREALLEKIERFWEIWQDLFWKNAPQTPRDQVKKLPSPVISPSDSAGSTLMGTPLPPPFPTEEKPNDSQRIEFPNGDVYEGQTRNNQPWGQWEHDQMHGKGTFFYTDGMSVEAFWIKGRIDYMKPVTIHYPNGNVYQGKINKDEQLDGFGIMNFPDGSWMFSIWREGAPEQGYGFLHLSDGGTYKGPTWGYEPMHVPPKRSRPVSRQCSSSSSAASKRSR